MNMSVFFPEKFYYMNSPGFSVLPEDGLKSGWALG